MAGVEELIFPMDMDTGAGVEPTSKINSDYEESRAPKTPRDADGRIEGDREPDMPNPDEELFVVMPLYRPNPAESILRPQLGFNWTIFYGRETAKEVAESQARGDPHTAYGVYGPYSSEEEVTTRPWDQMLSTAADVYEMMSVVVRRTYHPSGKVKDEIRELVCNHTSFGYVAPSKNIVEDKNVLNVPGSLLTNYLTPDNELISPNVQLLARPPTKEHMKDEEYAKVFKRVASAQRDAVDILIDNAFRRALPLLSIHNFKMDGQMEFAIVAIDGSILFKGLQPVSARKLPRAYAEILRTALTSFYGKVQSIVLNIGDLELCFNMNEEEN